MLKAKIIVTYFRCDNVALFSFLQRFPNWGLNLGPDSESAESSLLDWQEILGNGIFKRSIIF